MFGNGNETFPVGILSDGREILEVFEQTPSAFVVLLIYVEVTKIQSLISFLTFSKKREGKLSVEMLDAQFTCPFLEDDKNKII